MVRCESKTLLSLPVINIVINKVKYPLSAEDYLNFEHDFIFGNNERWCVTRIKADKDSKLDFSI